MCRGAGLLSGGRLLGMGSSSLPVRCAVRPSSMAHVFPVAHIEQHGGTSGDGGEQANDEVRIAQVLADATRKHKLDLRPVESKGFGVGERLYLAA
jgi:hypothetical protein